MANANQHAHWQYYRVIITEQGGSLKRINMHKHLCSSRTSITANSNVLFSYL